MKDNKNWVFALKATDQSANLDLGYLVFPDDKQAFEFLTYSERLKKDNPEAVSNEHTHYSAHAWVVVSKLEGEQIHTNGMFFLDKIEDANDEVLKCLKTTLF